MMIKRRALLLASIAAAVAIAVSATNADAAGLFRRAPAGNFILTGVSTNAGTVGGVSPDCCAPVPAPCCDTPCCRPNVCYVHRGCRRVCCDPCTSPIKQTLTFCHPCTGCKVAVDICVPGCCTGCPAVSERCTLIGCGAVTYQWFCGYSATIRFARSGDITVVYRG